MTSNNRINVMIQRLKVDGFNPLFVKGNSEVDPEIQVNQLHIQFCQDGSISLYNSVTSDYTFDVNYSRIIKALREELN